MAEKIVVDANLLLLWLAGLANPRIIASHRRLQKFEVRHFEVLHDIIQPYQKLVVTPHILAELWNLLGEDRGGWDEHRKQLVEMAVKAVGIALEIHDPAVDLTKRSEITWLGLADVSQLVAAENGYDLVSADGALCRQAMQLGIFTYHFWQLTDEGD